MQVSTVFDVRSFEPRFRHALIFSMFEGLSPGASFELASDHDPVHLREQFESVNLLNFEWKYLQQGPDLWRIEIRKKNGHKDGGCCGICG